MQFVTFRKHIFGGNDQPTLRSGSYVLTEKDQQILHDFYAIETAQSGEKALIADSLELERNADLILQKLTFIREICRSKSSIKIDCKAQDRDTLSVITQVMVRYALKHALSDDPHTHHAAVKAFCSLLEFSREVGIHIWTLCSGLFDTLKHQLDDRSIDNRNILTPFIELTLETTKTVKKLVSENRSLEPLAGQFQALNRILCVFYSLFIDEKVIVLDNGSAKNSKHSNLERYMLLQKCSAKFLILLNTDIHRNTSEEFLFDIKQNIKKLVFHELIIKKETIDIIISNDFLQRGFLKLLSKLLNIILKAENISDNQIVVFVEKMFSALSPEIITCHMGMLEFKATLESDFEDRMNIDAFLVILKLSLVAAQSPDNQSDTRQWPIHVVSNYCSGVKMQGSARVVHLLIDQDDHLFEGLLNLLHLYRIGNKNEDRRIDLRRILNPHFLFMEFISAISFDSTLLLDYLIGTDTCFREFLSLYLSEVLHNVDLFYRSVLFVAASKRNCLSCLAKCTNNGALGKNCNFISDGIVDQKENKYNWTSGGCITVDKVEIMSDGFGFRVANDAEQTVSTLASLPGLKLTARSLPKTDHKLYERLQVDGRHQQCGLVPNYDSDHSSDDEELDSFIPVKKLKDSSPADDAHHGCEACGLYASRVIECLLDFKLRIELANEKGHLECCEVNIVELIKKLECTLVNNVWFHTDFGVH